MELTNQEKVIFDWTRTLPFNFEYPKDKDISEMAKDILISLMKKDLIPDITFCNDNYKKVRRVDFSGYIKHWNIKTNEKEYEQNT